MEHAALNLDHPEILKAILAGGDVIAQEGCRTVLAVTVGNWLFDELAVLGTEGEDREEGE